jgi:hypothetical protein
VLLAVEFVEVLRGKFAEKHLKVHERKLSSLMKKMKESARKYLIPSRS